MANPKPTALLKAVKAGRVDDIRQLLAAGLSVEATDPNQLTPVMLAAQGGHLDAFRVLVEAEANLHALGLGQTDLLECAAAGGTVAIIQFLLDQGHPVDGHWHPASRVAERSGHMTPLILASINGHVEAVRLLLQAGANREAKFDGQTALKMVRDSIKHPLDEAQTALIPRWQAIATLLSEAPATVAASADEAVILREIGQFAANAGRPEFQQFRQGLEDRFGQPRPWKPMPDHGRPAEAVVRFAAASLSPKALNALQAEARAAGSQFVLGELWAPGEVAELVLFPTADKLAVVAAVGAAGANYSVRTDDVINWLRTLDGEQPFHLVVCTHESVGGAFTGPVKRAEALAERIVAFCPCSLDQGIDDARMLASVLKKKRAFLLRWD